MMNFSCNNKGQRVPPHPDLAAPIIASGQKKTCTTAGTNYTLTVVAGAMYKITARVDSTKVCDMMSLSITGTAATDANKEWNFNIGDSVVIHIPSNKTTLNMTSTIDATDVFISRLEV